MRVLVVLLLLGAVGCDTRLSVESNFTLAPESRLPKWVALPPGIGRNDVTVQLTYYTVAPPRIEVLKGTWPLQRRLVDISAPRLGAYTSPKRLDVPASDPRHSYGYEVLVSDGVVDIVEHRNSPVFRMSDDSEVWRQLASH